MTWGGEESVIKGHETNFLRAEALYDYRSTYDHPEEFSFSKGDTFDVSDDSGRLWEVRKPDGSTLVRQGLR